MSNNSELVNRVEARNTIDGVEDAIGKGEEHIVFATGKAVLLLISVSSDFGAGYKMSTHIFTYFSPVLFLSVCEVNRFEHDKLFFNGSLLK